MNLGRNHGPAAGKVSRSAPHGTWFLPVAGFEEFVYSFLNGRAAGTSKGSKAPERISLLKPFGLASGQASGASRGIPHLCSRSSQTRSSTEWAGPPYPEACSARGPSRARRIRISAQRSTWLFIAQSFESIHDARARSPSANRLSTVPDRRGQNGAVLHPAGPAHTGTRRLPRRRIHPTCRSLRVP